MEYQQARCARSVSLSETIDAQQERSILFTATLSTMLRSTVP